MDKREILKVINIIFVEKCLPNQTENDPSSIFNYQY